MKTIRYRDTATMTPLQVAVEFKNAWEEFQLRIDRAIEESLKRGRDADRSAKIWGDDVWPMLMRYGDDLVDQIIKKKAIPKGKEKKLELAGKAFNETKRFPTKATSWITTNKPGYRLLLEAAATWPERDTTTEAPLQIGGFSVIDSVGLNEKDLKTTQQNIADVQSLVKNSGIPGAAKILYGDLLLVGQIHGSAAAWYKQESDQVYLRPLIKRITDKQRQLFVHELAHRYWDKVMSADKKKEWRQHHLDLEYQRPDDFEIEPGTVFRNVHITGIKGDPVVDHVDDQFVYLVGPKNPKLRRGDAWKVLYEQAQKATFPTDYAATDPEEHFCEAFAMYVNGTLSKQHRDAFDQIVTGKQTKQAGVIKYPPKTAETVFRWARDILAQYVWQQVLETNPPYAAELIQYCKKLASSPGRPNTATRIYLDLTGWEYRDKLETYHNYSFKVLLKLQACPGHIGQWFARLDSLEICTGPLVKINSVDAFRKLLFEVRRTIQHELEHTVQTLLKRVLWLSEEGGLPSKRIRDESGGPSAIHPLRDVEFYPNLADSLADFSLVIKDIPKEAHRMALAYWLGEISKHELRSQLARQIKDEKKRFEVESDILFGADRIIYSFHQLKANQKDKWKKAVKVFLAEIQRRGFKLPGGGMKIARILWEAKDTLGELQHLLTRCARPIPIDKTVVGRVVDVMTTKVIDVLKRQFSQDAPLGDHNHPLIEPMQVPVKLLSGETAYVKTSVKAKKRATDWRVQSHQVVPGGRAMQFANPSDPKKVTEREIEIYVNGNYSPDEILTKFVGKGTEPWSLKTNLRRVLLHEMTHIIDPGSLKSDEKGDYLNQPTEVRARTQEITDQVLAYAHKEAEMMEGFTTIQSMVEHGLEHSSVWDTVRKNLNATSKRYILKAVYQAVADQKYALITKWLDGE